MVDKEHHPRSNGMRQERSYILVDYTAIKPSARRIDGWSLLHVNGDRIAHLFNTGEDELIGALRWRVWLDHKKHEGSARSSTEARETCEGSWLNISNRS